MRSKREYDWRSLLEGDPKGKQMSDELGVMLDGKPDRENMNKEELEKFIDLICYGEKLYVDDYCRKHPSFPARAAMGFNDIYQKRDFLFFTDPEEITIPSAIQYFTIWELRVSIMLKSCGCSDRTVAEFLDRGRDTVARYLAPLNRAVEESYSMSFEARDVVLKEAIKKCVEAITENRGKNRGWDRSALV